MNLLSESRFNAYNQLAVVTLMLLLGFNIKDILKNISKLKIAETRYEKIPLNNNKYLIKHLTKGQNPLACSNVFDFVKNYEGKRTIEFEGREFPIPSRLEHSLRVDYGDSWMYVPSGDGQLKHNPIVEDISRPFSEYTASYLPKLDREKLISYDYRQIPDKV